MSGSRLRPKRGVDGGSRWVLPPSTGAVGPVGDPRRTSWRLSFQSGTIPLPDTFKRHILSIVASHLNTRYGSLSVPIVDQPPLIPSGKLEPFVAKVKLVGI